MTKREVVEAIEEAYGNSEYTDEMIKVIEQGCHEDKVKVLDKIRTEIERMTPTYHNANWSITDLVPISEVLKLIDKYKAESEDK